MPILAFLCVCEKPYCHKTLTIYVQMVIILLSTVYITGDIQIVFVIIIKFVPSEINVKGYLGMQKTMECFLCKESGIKLGSIQ